MGATVIFNNVYPSYFDGRIEETWRNADDLGGLLQLDARIKASEFESHGVIYE